MKAILANPKRVSEVKNVHSSIATTFKDLTLEQILIVGFNWPVEKIQDVIFSHKYELIKKFFYEWDYMKGKEQLSKFKLYNQPAITRHARFRAVFLQEMKVKGYELNKKLTIPQLEEISALSIGYATVTYAIKCYLLANFNEDGIKAFKGIQAQTGPVHNSLDHLFGHKFTNYQQTVLCNDLALDTGLSATYINSALYTMG